MHVCKPDPNPTILYRIVVEDYYGHENEMVEVIRGDEELASALFF
jgi:hypothetical protein